MSSQIYKGLQHFATLWTYIFAPFRLIPLKLSKFKECLKGVFLAMSFDIYLLIIIIIIIIIIVIIIIIIIIIIVIIIINFIEVSDSLAI